MIRSLLLLRGVMLRCASSLQKASALAAAETVHFWLQSLWILREHVLRC